jgi:hypothetical protein
MGCTLVVNAAVARRIVCKFLICLFSKGLRERAIIFAAIDQERSLALCDVCLRWNNAQDSGGICVCLLRMTHVQIFMLEEGRMGNDGHVDDIVERKIEHKAG